MGLHHLFAFGHHYGPEPWCAIEGGRPDWMPSYYHRADSAGIGFDRSSKGSNAIGQYPDNLAKRLDNPALCPEEFLLWFHHLPWEYQLPSGDTLRKQMMQTHRHHVVYNSFTAAHHYVDYFSSYLCRDVATVKDGL